MPKSVEYETERIARRLAVEAGQNAALWELYLTDAYRIYYSNGPDPEESSDG